MSDIRMVEVSTKNVNEIKISTIENNVSDAKALVIFAHGAGADKSSAFMREVTALLNDKKINVLRFNFNYMDKRAIDNKRYLPERMPKLVSCFASVIANITTLLPVFLAGKSMGGRVAATMAETYDEKIKGIICLGYPFHPQKQPDKLRLAPLQNTTQPILIVQGDRDALGDQQEISTYDFSEKCQMVFLADGDHNLKPRVKSGFTHQQHLRSTANEILSFISKYSKRTK